MQLLLDSTPASSAVALFAVFAGYDSHSLTVASGPAITFDNVSGAVEVMQHLAAKSKSDVAGVNDKEKTEIASAIKAGLDASKLAAFNTTLNGQSFVAASSHRPSVADFVYWAAVGASLSAADFSAHPNIARWARYLLASVPRNAAYGLWVKAASVPALPAALASKIFELDIVANAAADSKLRAAPAAAAPAGDKKAAAAAVAPAGEKKASAAAVAPAAAAASSGDKKAEKKEKPAKEAKAAAPAAAEVSQVYRVDFRVAKVLSAAAHPTEARLLVLQVDVGAEAGGVRTVVSGLADYYKIDELANRLVVCIVNLKAGDLKGVVSAGRLMVATGADGKKELATPPAAAAVGERVTFASVPKDKAPDAELAGKRFNDILKLLKTDGSKNVCYGADVFTTSAGAVTVPSVVDGTVA